MPSGLESLRGKVPGDMYNEGVKVPHFTQHVVLIDPSGEVANQVVTDSGACPGDGVDPESITGVKVGHFYFHLYRGVPGLDCTRDATFHIHSAVVFVLDESDLDTEKWKARVEAFVGHMGSSERIVVVTEKGFYWHWRRPGGSLGKGRLEDVCVALCGIVDDVPNHVLGIAYPIRDAGSGEDDPWGLKYKPAVDMLKEGPLSRQAVCLQVATILHAAVFDTLAEVSTGDGEASDRLRPLAGAELCRVKMLVEQMLVSRDGALPQCQYYDDPRSGAELGDESRGEIESKAPDLLRRALARHGGLFPVHIEVLRFGWAERVLEKIPSDVRDIIIKIAGLNWGMGHTQLRFPLFSLSFTDATVLDNNASARRVQCGAIQALPWRGPGSFSRTPIAALPLFDTVLSESECGLLVGMLADLACGPVGDDLGTMVKPFCDAIVEVSDRVADRVCGKLNLDGLAKEVASFHLSRQYTLLDQPLDFIRPLWNLLNTGNLSLDVVLCHTFTNEAWGALSVGSNRSQVAAMELFRKSGGALPEELKDNALVDLVCSWDVEKRKGEPISATEYMQIMFARNELRHGRLNFDMQSAAREMIYTKVEGIVASLPFYVCDWVSRR